MRVGFAGTPHFAARVLEAILAAGFRVELVLAQPDRPHGRGLQSAPGPVKAIAIARGLALHQPATLKAEAQRAAIVAQPLDVMVVAAYGLIVPSPMLSWPLHGCLNVHASLLPRWRGAAPIARAILAGDAQTGVSIMRMDEGLDTGPILSRRPVAIAPRETSGSLHDKLAAIGAEAVVETLRGLSRGERLGAEPQDEAAATYARKLEPGETVIDWNADARAIDRAVRAFDPVPGARTRVGGATVKIWKAQPLVGRFGAPGTVVRAGPGGIVVSCGDGALAIAELQPAGGRRMEARAFLAGHPLGTGMRLGAD
jgi:methionyl-tRNA formyltransferase